MPTSSGVIWTASPMARMLASRFACVRMTPLGSPVEPDVYWSSAMSLPWRARLPVTCNGSAVLGDQEVVALGVVRRAIPQDIDERFGREDTGVGPGAVQFLNSYGSPQRRAFFLIFCN